ncbi:MAG: hypothetical protein JWM68_5096 [Verrucomicrobiales bacterium]|nr:hypothetical protein [Verrucomicrobiales bacterium]
MKNLLIALLMTALAAQAGTSISSVTTNNSAYGANIGWINAYADNTNGAVIGEYVCSGNIYSANCGWINLGNGVPVNGIGYQNNSSTDFGVNHDGAGNLRGYAYGANIGWINLETNGAPKVNLKTGVLSGSAWGANVGWISLSNAFAVVKTDSLIPAPDTDGDGIADAWERTYAGSNLTTLSGGSHDADGDGVSDYKEYLADTNPLLASDYLKITAYSASFPNGGGDNNILTWTSKPSRFYHFCVAGDLSSPFNTFPFLISPDAGATTTSSIGLGSTTGLRFFRIEAVRPFTP